MLDGKTDFDRALGRRIREARVQAGVKQEQLARAIGLSRTSITNIERGRQGVQVYLLARIGEVLGRQLTTFLPPIHPAAPLADKVRSLEPRKREWAERVMREPSEDRKNAR